MIWIALLACGSSDPEPTDGDHDGFPVEVDCDDGNSDAFPGANEFCDGVDNDCDGEVDEGEPLGTREFFADADGDGFGDSGVRACTPPPGHVRYGGDCDESDASRNPGAPETCNGIDDDCNGRVDDRPGWRDADEDGFGDPNAEAIGCDVAVDDRTDCDDADALISPAAPELCNGIDDDCDGNVDDQDSEVMGGPWYADADNDGFGVDAAISTACDPGPGWASTPGDCDDFAAEVNPDALELCNAIDEDCDGDVAPSSAAYARSPSIGLTLTASGSSPLFVQPVELDSTIDGDRLRFVTGDCDAGFRVMPARWLDGAQSAAGATLVVSWTGDDFDQTAAGRLFQDMDPIGDVSAGSSLLMNGSGSVGMDGFAIQALDFRGPSLFDETGAGVTIPTDTGVLRPDLQPLVTEDPHPSLGRLVIEDPGSPSFQREVWMIAEQPHVFSTTTVVFVDGVSLTGSITVFGGTPTDPQTVGTVYGDLELTLESGPGVVTVAEADSVSFDSVLAGDVPGATTLGPISVVLAPTGAEAVVTDGIELEPRP